LQRQIIILKLKKVSQTIKKKLKKVIRIVMMIVVNLRLENGDHLWIYLN